MKNIIDNILKINSETFDYLVIIFLVLILFESIFHKIRFYYINIELFLFIIIILGIINIIYKLKK
jgi:hypothetical protein